MSAASKQLHFERLFKKNLLPVEGEPTTSNPIPKTTSYFTIWPSAKQCYRTLAYRTYMKLFNQDTQS